jgi:RNA-directed DNA polymerase
MENILALHADLKGRTYTHGSYHHFRISDPKPRDIHKASVRDRLLHHALYRKLYPFFDKSFIAHSYSCRLGKGTHSAIRVFRGFVAKTSLNDTKTIWVLKCDVKKFFASVDHNVLFKILEKRIPDKDVLRLIKTVVGSFHNVAPGKGLPLGNLTSQLLVNIYMNELDQFVKHRLKARQFIRYADDFVIFSRDRKWLESILSDIRKFMKDKLQLSLHPNKISISTIASGVDFLGWVHFSDHRVLRTTTKRRMFQQLQERKGSQEEKATFKSYRGLLGHGNARKLENML